MATANISILANWTKIADSSESEVLITWDDPQIVEFATTRDNNEPTTVGHRLDRTTPVSRKQLGSGNIWAKLISNIPHVDLRLSVSRGGGIANGAVAYSPDDINSFSDVLKKYTYQGAPGHHLRFQRTTNGQAIVSLVADPFVLGSTSWLQYNTPAKMPMALEFEASIEGRARTVHSGMLLGNFNDPLEVTPTPVEITKWWQHNTDNSSNYSAASGPYITLELASPLPDNVFLGDWICIKGISNNASPTSGYSSKEIQNAAIRHINDFRTRITVAFSDDSVILNADSGGVITTVPGTAYISFFDNMLGATHGMGMRFSNNGQTSAALFTKMGGDSFMSSASNSDIRADQRITVANMTPQYLNGVSGSVEIRPLSRYRLESRVDECSFQDQPADSTNIQSNRLTRSSVKPNLDLDLYARAYIRMPEVGNTIAGDIVSVSKTGTTTATVVTRLPHGLKTGDSVTLRGVVNQTNFANNSSAAGITVVNATTFTCIWGSAVTASSYGGVVVRHTALGNLDVVSVITGAVQYVVWDNTTNILVVTGSVNWGINGIGALVWLRGVTKSDGTSLGLDGMWRVHNVSTTSAVLTPIFDAFGVRVSPNPASITTAAGGLMGHVPEFRLHDLSIEAWTEQRVMVDGAGTNRLDKALPIYSTGGSLGIYANTSVSASNGTGGVHVRPAITGVPDVASAALTSTTTTSSYANDFGNAIQVTIPVTAVSGTSPTLDVRIEESFDGGTNWVTLYEFQRITATGIYNSPILRTTGRNLRYVQTVGGTSPSFTRSITRNLMPFATAEPHKRIMDRSIVPNTLSSVTPVLFSGSANNAQLIVNMGAITTTAPVIKIQGSEDGTNWYDLPAGSVTGVASSTVQVTVNNISATFVRAIVATAGVGATLGYVSLKAWS